MRNQSVEKEAEPPDFERLQVQFKATGEPSGIRTPDTLIRSYGVTDLYLQRDKNESTTPQFGIFKATWAAYRCLYVDNDRSPIVQCSSLILVHHC